MSQDDLSADFLRRLERGESTLEELTQLPPEQRGEVLQALFRNLKIERQNESE